MRLQQTGTHFLDLVDETRSPALDDFRTVQNAPDRILEKWVGYLLGTGSRPVRRIFGGARHLCAFTVQ